MSDDIFANEAPKCWARNLPVVPIEPGTKRPPLEMKGWQGNLAALPNEQKRAAWLSQYANYGIGLLLGIPLESGEVIDALDVDDDRLRKLVRYVLGLNRSEGSVAVAAKRGKKGATLFVRAPKSLKSTVVKGAGGLGNIDFLAAGKQAVMPPSIHPDTGKQYEVIGQSLLEMDFALLPGISRHQLELLKATIGSEYAAVIISGNATHDAGVGLTAVLVHTGATDDEITTIFTGLLPDDYGGNSLKELPEWIKSARKKGFDAADEDDEKISAKLVKLARREGIGLFRNAAQKEMALATLPQTGPAIAYRVNSSAVKFWLRHIAHTAWKTSVNAHSLSEAVATLEANALFEGEPYSVYARVAGDNKSITIDLGRDDCQMVQIGPEGWKTEISAERKFVRGAGFESLPLPQANGDGLRRLRSLLGLDDQNYRLLVAFLINALKPQGPYFVLLVEGEQGSGKSFFCEVIKRVIDPNIALRLRLPDKPQDLMIQAKEFWLLSFDNTSGMKAEISDILCTLATGGGTAVRKLYTDEELNVLSYTRPFMINGISGYVTRPDLMERAIPIKLPPMDEDRRQTEAELTSEFNSMLPSVLAALFSAVAHALRTYDTVDPPRRIRMADAARWIRAAEEGLGEQAGAIINAIDLAQNEFVAERINDDPLAMRLRAITRGRPFEGYVSELFLEITLDQDRVLERGLPKSPPLLSKQLNRIRPALAKVGITVEDLGRDRGGRRIKISSDYTSLPKLES